MAAEDADKDGLSFAEEAGLGSDVDIDIPSLLGQMRG